MADIQTDEEFNADMAELTILSNNVLEAFKNSDKEINADMAELAVLSNNALEAFKNSDEEIMKKSLNEINKMANEEEVNNG